MTAQHLYATAWALLLAAGTGAHAQGLQGSYTLQGGSSNVNGSVSSNFNLTQNSPVTRAAVITVPSTATAGSGGASFIASADAGLLDIQTQASSTSAIGSSGSAVNGALIFSGGGAFASWSDFIISGPASATTVMASVNGTLVVSNSLSDNTNANLALRGITASVTVPGGTAFSVTNTLVSESFISVEFALPVGQAFTLGMSLKTSNSQTMIAGTFPTGGGAAQAGLTETLSQSASLSMGVAARGAGPAAVGSVFNLPAGYTLNSVQANIVDNQWLGPTLPVPEPATSWLAGLGGLALALRLKARGHAQRTKQF